MKKPPFYKSLFVAFKGLFLMLKNERNFQLEIFAFLINIGLIIFFRINYIEASFIILVCGLVLTAEILNTAIEKLCDFAEPNFNPKIGWIKDIAAAAVLLATLFAIIVGVLIYWPYLENMLSS